MRFTFAYNKNTISWFETKGHSMFLSSVFLLLVWKHANDNNQVFNVVGYLENNIRNVMLILTTELCVCFFVSRKTILFSS